MTFISRRDLIKFGILGGAASFLSPRAGWAQTGSPAVTPFTIPLSIPPVLRPVSTDETTDYYQITMREGQKEIIPGLLTTVWGYNGIYPGPTIKARSNRRVVVRQQNDLSVHTSVHLHGGHTPASSDGHPNDMIEHGQYKDYVYPNEQIAATLWYHDHVMDHTARNVYRGLAGCYIITDDYEEALPLPSGRYDVPLVIQDRTFSSTGELVYNPTFAGFQGDRLLVNGAIQPFFHVERKKYRFRILNGSNARNYELKLSNDRQFIQIGSDGGLLSAPVARDTMRIAPGERVDVIIDFAEVNAGTLVDLNNVLGTGSVGQVMQFRVMAKSYGKWGQDRSSIPATLRPVVPIPESQASVTRLFTLGASMGMFTINGQVYSPTRIDADPILGSTEIWTFQNTMPMDHPMHIHLVQSQILDVNGAPPPIWDRGWKDTFKVGPNQTVRVISTFKGYTGDYILHCHNLEHEDLGMMAQFRVS